MSRRRSALAALAVVAVVAACDQSLTVGSRWIRQQEMAAITGGTMAVTAADSSVLAGASVALPPAALPADALVTVELASSFAADPKAAGPAVSWGPADVALVHGAALTLPYVLDARQNAADLIVLTLDASTAAKVTRIEHASLTVDEAAHSVTFTSLHLGVFQAAAIERCIAINDCATGQFCGSGGECHPPCSTVECQCSEVTGCLNGLVCREGLCRAPADAGH